MWITNMGNHGAAGVSQNAGVLVVLVRTNAGPRIGRTGSKIPIKIKSPFRENAFQNVICKMAPILFRPEYVNTQDLEDHLPCKTRKWLFWLRLCKCKYYCLGFILSTPIVSVSIDDPATPRAKNNGVTLAMLESRRRKSPAIQLFVQQIVEGSIQALRCEGNPTVTDGFLSQRGQ